MSAARIEELPPAESAEYAESHAEPESDFDTEVLVVTSPKGGCGKTTVAVNLAVGLARRAKGPVLLIDADPQFGNVAAALDLTPSHALPEAAAHESSDTAGLLALLNTHPSGLRVLCGAASPVDGEAVSGSQLGFLIERLAGAFRYIVVDTASGLGEHALAALDHASHTVLLSELSVPSLRDLRKELDVLNVLRLAGTRSIVLNLAERKAGLNVRDAESILGASVDEVLPRSQVVALVTNRGVPILIGESRDPAVLGIARLVSKLGGAAAPSPRSLRVLLRKALA